MNRRAKPFDPPIAPSTTVKDDRRTKVEDTPPDILYEILEHVLESALRSRIALYSDHRPRRKQHSVEESHSRRDTSAAALVCRNWRSAILAWPTFWSYVFVDGCSPNPLEFIRYRLERSCSTTRGVKAPLHIVLSGSQKWDVNVFESCLAIVLQHLSRIEDLVINNPRDLASLDLFSAKDGTANAPLLRRLCIIPVQRTDKRNRDRLADYLAHRLLGSDDSSQSLEELRLSHVNVKSLAPKLSCMTNLTELQLSSWPDEVLCKEIVSTLSKVPNLAYLTLWCQHWTGKYHVGDVTVAEPNGRQQFPGLRKFTIIDDSCRMDLIQKLLGRLSFPFTTAVHHEVRHGFKYQFELCSVWDLALLNERTDVSRRRVYTTALWHFDGLYSHLALHGDPPSLAGFSDMEALRPFTTRFSTRGNQKGSAIKAWSRTPLECRHHFVDHTRAITTLYCDIGCVPIEDPYDQSGDYFTTGYRVGMSHMKEVQTLLMPVYHDYTSKFLYAIADHDESSQSLFSKLETLVLLDSREHTPGCRQLREDQKRDWWEELLESIRFRLEKARPLKNLMIVCSDPHDLALYKQETQRRPLSALPQEIFEPEGLEGLQSLVLSGKLKLSQDVLTDIKDLEDDWTTADEMLSHGIRD
ncbi:hypothetical protein EIP91_005581 [Steccherinum ochraceum]|uniref:F-box domain-containing protein n=1 Tax=Steccherinum ochraceum TaxID=92696 RepID=A0A4R0RFF8_9APHY|nr:hypothetical protein EIP91_005581 [Steccherinum ochraceum]